MLGQWSISVLSIRRGSRRDIRDRKSKYSMIACLWSWNCREEGYKQGLLISETARGSIKQKGRLTLTFLRFLIFERVKTRWKEPSKYFR